MSCRGRGLGAAAWLVALGVLLAPAASRAEQRIAVLELRSPRQACDAGQEGPGCTFLRTAADEVRAGVLAASRDRGCLVITRENLAMLLKEMGGTCAEGDCEVETARNIGADLVVSGEVAQVEGTWLLTLKLHETRRGALLASNRFEGASQLSVIRAAGETAAVLLSRGLGEAGASAPPAPGRAALGHFEEESRDVRRAPDEVPLEFRSTPPGAVVLVDGRLRCALTPCARAVTAGSHQITMQKERYLPASRRVEVSRSAEVALRLEPAFGWLSVRTAPGGLMVKVNGKPAGPTPIERREIDPGVVEVALEDRCHARSLDRLQVQAGAHYEVEFQVKERPAALKVTAQDGAGNALDAAVVVDGRELGRTGRTYQVPVCSQLLRVEGPPGAPWEQRLELSEADLTSVTATFGAPSPQAAVDPAPPQVRTGDAERAYGEMCRRGSAGACAVAASLALEAAPPNPLRAVQLYQRSCEGGDARGCMYLGGLYLRGRGVARDETRARRLFAAACAGGVEVACGP